MVCHDQIRPIVTYCSLLRNDWWTMSKQFTHIRKVAKGFSETAHVISSTLEDCHNLSPEKEEVSLLASGLYLFHQLSLTENRIGSRTCRQIALPTFLNLPLLLHFKKRRFWSSFKVGDATYQRRLLRAIVLTSSAQLVATQTVFSMTL